MSGVHVPTRPLPQWLQGLTLPTTREEALDHARARGASEDVLELLEDLPAEVFSSEVGLQHALTGVDEEDLAGLHPVPGSTSHDGGSS